MRVLIIAGRCLAAVLGLSALCIVLALGFFNPNARRGEIQAWVTEQTGRSFTLNGELGWRLWPHPAVTLPHTRLGAGPEARNTGDTPLPFAEWQQASLSVRLWPLLWGRLEFGAVQLRGLRVRLQREANGRGNWEDLLQLLTADRSPGRFKFTSSAGLKVDDAEITFDDAAAGRMTTMHVVSLQTSAMASDRPVDVMLKAQAGTRVHADNGATGNLYSQSIDLPFTLAMQVQTDAALQRWQIDDLQFATQMTTTGVLSGEGTIKALPVTLRLRHADWQVAQQLSLDALHVTADEAQLTTDKALLTQLSATPHIAATLQVEVPNLRQWLQRLAIDVPVTRDATALQHLSAQLRIAGNVQDLQLQLTPLLLDQTRCDGEARWQRADGNSRYTIDLRADQLDLDRYLPATTPAGSRQPSSGPVPIDWLRGLHAQGRLRIDKAQWQAIRVQQLTMTLDGT